MTGAQEVDDVDEGLFGQPAQSLGLDHDDLAAAEALQARLGDELDWPAVIPRSGERVRIG